MCVFLAAALLFSLANERENQHRKKLFPSQRRALMLLKFLIFNQVSTPLPRGLMVLPGENVNDLAVFPPI